MAKTTQQYSPSGCKTANKQTNKQTKHHHKQRGRLASLDDEQVTINKQIVNKQTKPEQTNRQTAILQRKLEWGSLKRRRCCGTLHRPLWAERSMALNVWRGAARHHLSGI
jgi:hypothetical protein